MQLILQPPSVTEVAAFACLETVRKTMNATLAISIRVVFCVFGLLLSIGSLMLALVGAGKRMVMPGCCPSHVAFPITDDGNHVARKKRRTNLRAAPAKRSGDTENSYQ